MRSQERGARSEERRVALALRPDSPTSNLRSPTSPRGMTLIELLVVIIIVTTLVSAAIPLMSPTNDDRRLREASRMANTFIATAQANAIALQRPFGVAIKRLAKDTGTLTSPRPEDDAVSIEMYYVEQPSPFVGFNEQSMARVALYTPSSISLYNPPPPVVPQQKNLVIIQFVSRGTTTTPPADRLPAGWVIDQIPSGVLRPLDVIQINGTRYQLLSDGRDTNVPPQLDTNKEFFLSNTGLNGTNTVQIVAQPMNDSGQMINVKYDDKGNTLGTVTPAASPYWTDPSPYKILRQPMKTSAEPLQLPEGSAIDLRASGLGDSDYFYVPSVHDNTSDILIMFAPEGRVSRLDYSQAPVNTIPYDQAVVDNIFLLVGKRENCPPPDVGNDKTLSTSTLPPSNDPNRERLLADMKKPVNWLRGESRWIVIGSQSGRVVTIENSFVDPAAAISKYTTSPYTASQSSEELRNGQIQMAREFIKEMKQLGGR
jgi:prepilin-type N-terminal cleavage/methylation domain-containing protein